MGVIERKQIQSGLVQCLCVQVGREKQQQNEGFVSSSPVIFAQSF